MNEKFLIGTYTINDSEGIYQIELDTEKKQLQNTLLVAKIGSPTYLAESKAKKIYAVDRNMEQPELRGGVAVFDGKKIPSLMLQENIETGTSDAFVAIDEEKQLVFTANYHMGHVSVYSINPDGTLELTDRAFAKGEVGPKPEQADGAHPHYANLTPDNRLIVCDLGIDKVSVYDVSDEGKLSLVSEYEPAPGYGPRNISFAGNSNKGYLVGELSSEVSVLDYDQKTGSLTLEQEISTIPDDWTEHNGAAAIKISRDNRFIYVSNRGNDSIAVFKILANGTLERIQIISTEGEFPRDFEFSSDESLLIACNQNSDNATLFERNSETGKLTMIQKDFEVPEGTCIVRRDV
ncbi:6-phosphogluconolactonase [Fructilactobacillus lindneri]|uniref:3-carboxymuconate cyclase n=2 Tax=Fructilactobacillus lindneri TaxID=53444 RepID=A0A0R2K3M8_9LACO|nr:lactonase family protein [Fructilactobacillus lindneri]ANZ57363.1 6-phosphogluconolactonase [Fructilactobacillus lindneri]ANZ58628.1 6-phosphogluconolactonase [Fructilactobacillus lindneri]KRN80701.1 3-carboxymuconate cyclase [Fructilactobacillus lindneri DSM 20690 = JCM 11027]POG97666.1 6-phosphogluconolactonase [Fructilactobacillus lindneri]POG99003.1 6-phosphogluconolactonase [Fructilactobacillus lindneri]